MRFPRIAFCVALQVLCTIHVFSKVSGEDSSCTDKGSCTKGEATEGDGLGKYKPDPRWQKYLSKIDSAEASYTACEHDDCLCYSNVWEEDLARFKSGIDNDLFLQAKSRGVHYQIIKHKLFRQKDCIFEARCNGVEHFILEIIEDLPNMEFILNTHDWPQVNRYHGITLPVFSFSKDQNYADIMYPAWTFWEGGPAVWPIYPTGLGRWDEQRQIIPKAAGAWPWQAKLTQGFFLGSRTSEERDALILLSRAKPALVDAKYTKNQAWKSDADTLYEPAAVEVKLEEHCKYKYLFNFRGVAASFRYKHLFLCGSLVFHVGEDWLEFFYSALQPWVHYIPVRTDLADAEELLEFAAANDEIVRRIADRGREFIMKHLKLSDVSCYWRHLLTNYAKLVKYKVKRDKSLNRIKAQA